MLWPIAFAACFTFYFVDLFLLLKYYQRPPSYNEKIGKYTISVFEYSVFVNALFCIWLYGNQSILASQDVVEGGSLAYTQLQSYAGFSSTNVTLGRNRTLDDDNDYMSHINVTSRKKYIEGTIFDTMISRITRAHTFVSTDLHSTLLQSIEFVLHQHLGLLVEYILPWKKCKRVRTI